MKENKEELIPLSLARNYVSNWTVLHAIRELIANAVDTGNYSIEIDKGTLEIITYAGSIPREHLLLGSGSKSNKTDTIGQFNEGMKLALLILEREGFYVSIQNGNILWLPCFQHSDLFGKECLHIVESKFSEGIKDQVVITIQGISQDLEYEIINKHLVFHEDREVHETGQGEILLDDCFKGHIFCGGIWVAEDPTFEYGYNFNTDCLKLDRDRQTVKQFDIQWQTKEMWASISEDPDDDQLEHLASCIGNNKNDTKFLYSSCPKVADVVSDKLLDSFVEDNGEDAVITDDYDEAERLKESGYKNVVFSDNSVLVKTIKGSKKYQTVILKEKENPSQILLDFYDEWRDNMGIDMDNAYQVMMDKLEQLI